MKLQLKSKSASRLTLDGRLATYLTAAGAVTATAHFARRLLSARRTTSEKTDHNVVDCIDRCAKSVLSS